MIEIMVHISGSNLEHSYYTFNISKYNCFFTVSTRLIRLEKLKNTSINLNGLSLGRRIILKITDPVIEDFLSGSESVKEIGKSLLKSKIINHYKIN